MKGCSFRTVEALLIDGNHRVKSDISSKFENLITEKNEKQDMRERFLYGILFLVQNRALSVHWIA